MKALISGVLGLLIGSLLFFYFAYRMFWQGKSVKSIVIEKDEEKSLEYLGKSLDLKSLVLLVAIVILSIMGVIWVHL